MANINNLRIITEFGELVYRQAKDLNISFNRIVDDFTDITNRFGDYSYEFDLPIVKENSKVFSFANAMGQKKIFVKNKNISCQVYNNNALLLDGLINLEGVTQDSFKCKFYSKFKELIDTISSKTDDGNDRTLRSLNIPVIEDWQYESSIINHIQANYHDSDETTHQYPFNFYSTNYCQTSYYSGTTDNQGNTFSSDRDYQNYYYCLNSIAGNENRVYEHQLPPAIYITTIVKQILTDAGWKLGGQFFNDKNIKRIVLTYAGDEDIYDQATERVSGSTSVNLQLAKFLPDIAQADFLKGLINYFNLYFRIDINNKVVEFETYNTYFNNADSIDPYDVTNKIDKRTVSLGYIENNNPTIRFKSPNNKNVMGDNRVMSGATTNAFETIWITGSSKNFNQTFNRVGTTDEIEVPFSAPTIKRHLIYNNYNISGNSLNAGVHNMYLPLLSKQTPNDNNNMKFNKKDEDTYLFNNENTIKFQGDGSLMYYYGISDTDFINKSTKGSLNDYMYINVYTGTTINRVPIGICSPFALINYRTAIDEWLNQISVNNIEDRRTTTATYLQTIWQMLGKSSGITTHESTDFSLVFDDNGYFHETLWTAFHKSKWDRYTNSELLSGTINMNEYDWSQLQINRPIKYEQELYSLVSIEGYNPILRNGQIKMIKKL